jgi:hypothetical protein
VSYFKYGIASESVNFAKGILILSALGIFTKLLNIDLSKLKMLGISFNPDASGLVPGFIGLALLYVYTAFWVARFEVTLEQSVSEEFKTVNDIVHGSKKTQIAALFVSPMVMFVYGMPILLGAIAIYLLWADSMAVLSTIWSLL